MGQFSIWHWVIVLILVGVVYLIVKSARDAAKSGGSELLGVKGWLLFFIIGLSVLSPLVGLGQTAAAITGAEFHAPMLKAMDNWATYKTGTWLLLFSCLAWQWYVAYGLVKHRVPLSVARTKRFLLLAPGILVLGDIVLSTSLMDVTAPGEWVAALFKGYIASAVWYAYFVRSRRVRNTYGLESVRHVEPAPNPVSPPPPVPDQMAGLSAQPQVTPPLQQRSLEERLTELKRLFEAGLINQQEYEAKKAAMMQSL